MRDSGEIMMTPGRNSAITASTSSTMAGRHGFGEVPRNGWLGRILHRRKTTTYQRCLAVHIHFAGPRSALW